MLEDSVSTPAVAPETATVSLTPRPVDVSLLNARAPADGAAGALPAWLESFLLSASNIPYSAGCGGIAARPALRFLDARDSGVGCGSLVFAKTANWSVEGVATCDDAAGDDPAGDEAICGPEATGTAARFAEGATWFSFPGCTRSTAAATTTPAASAAQRRVGQARVGRAKFSLCGAGIPAREAVARSASVSMAIGAAPNSAGGSARAISSRQSPQRARCSRTFSRSLVESACSANAVSRSASG